MAAQEHRPISAIIAAATDEFEAAVQELLSTGVMLKFLWTHPNTGGKVPHNKEDHKGEPTTSTWDGGQHGMTTFARIDNFRGKSFEDPGNRAFIDLLVGQRSAGLRALLKRYGLWMFNSSEQSLKYERSCGNWCECLVGSCYTLAVSGSNLPPDHQFIIRPEYMNKAAIRTWIALEGLGFGCFHLEQLSLPRPPLALAGPAAEPSAGHWLWVPGGEATVAALAEDLSLIHI